MKIIIASDHGGYKLKQELTEELKKTYEIEDLGPYEENFEDDYPDFANKVAEKISKENPIIGNNQTYGILICKSSAGMTITANKYKKIRAVSVFTEKQAKHSREHNDANIISLSADETNIEAAINLINVWLNAKFTNEERHIRRLKKIEEIEK